VCFPIQLTTRRSDQRSKKYSTELEKQGGAQLECRKNGRSLIGVNTANWTDAKIYV
jgi:hypothetical protein